MAKVKQLKNNQTKVNKEPESKANNELVRCTYNPFFFRENEGGVKTIVKLDK
jgi:hypothetical protein